MSVWSWLKLTVCLWLLRKSFKAAGWLLVFAGITTGVHAVTNRSALAGLGTAVAAPYRAAAK